MKLRIALCYLLLTIFEASAAKWKLSDAFVNIKHARPQNIAKLYPKYALSPIIPLLKKPENKFEALILWHAYLIAIYFQN